MRSNKLAAESGSKNAGHGTDPLGVNSEIGRKLKQYYDDLIAEDVPDKFADLLKQLEGSDKSTTPALSEGE